MRLSQITTCQCRRILSSCSDSEGLNEPHAGVGHVLATDAVALDTDTRGVDVQWSENATADSFGKNLVFARCESRYATSVFSPLGVVSLDLTA
jgi:hypothetical protein